MAAGSVLDADVLTACRAAGTAGFDAVGLRVSGPHAVTEPADFRAVARTLADFGLELFDVEVHRIGTDTGGPERLVEAAAELGARHLLVVSDLDDLGRTRDELGLLAERCRDAGVVAAVEYMAWTTPSDPATAIELAAATGCVVVCDVLHHTRVGAGVEDLAALVESGRLGWVQLCDAPARAPASRAALVDEARHHRCPPGDGDLPLADLLAQLPATVPLSVEVQSDSLTRRLTPLERAALLAERSRRLIR